MQRGEAPKINMPLGSREVLQRPADSRERRKREKPGRAAKRAARSRLPVLSSAFALSLMWLGGFAAFVYGFYAANLVPLLSLPPMVWAGLVAAALLPFGFIWVGAAVFMRLTDMNEAALRLATVSRELIDPTTTAANDVAKLGATIRKELEGLNREVDGAVARVGMLETRLKEQTSMIDETAKRVDKRTIDMTNRLSEEREKVDAITRTLSAEGRILSETLDAQAQAIDVSAQAAEKALKEAEEALTKRTEGLDKTAGEAAETTKSIAADIERETGKLESVSANARSRSEAITTRFTEQHKLMVATVEKQAEQQTRLDAAMDQQQRLISKTADAVSEQIAKMAESVGQQTSRVATLVAQQIQAIESSVGEQTGKISGEVTEQIKAVEDALSGLNAKLSEMAETQIDAVETAVAAHTGELAGKMAAEAETIHNLLTSANTAFEETVASARRRAIEAGEGFAGQAAAMEKAAAAAAAKLDDAVETVKLLSSQTREDLDTQVRTADTLFQEQARNARRLLRTQADELGAALEASLNELRDRMTGLAEQGNVAMVERANELDEALRRSEHRMRALYQRLDESIEGVTEGTSAVGKRLAETADAFEARMAQFPAHAEEAAKRAHDEIHNQIKKLARIADAAAEKVENVEKSVSAPKAPPADDQPPLPLGLSSAEPEQRAAPERAAQTPAPAQAPTAEPHATDAAPEKKERQAIPDLPGRDVYPQIWEGMDRSGTRRPRIGRPVLGTFDDLAKNLANRFRPGGRADRDTPMGLKAAASIGALRAAQEEDISDFRVIRNDEVDKPSNETGSDHPRSSGLDRPAPEAPRKSGLKFEERGWKDILASVDRQAEERAAAVRRSVGEGDDASFQRDALLIIEKLQAMSIDLDRALEDAPPTELLDRYMSGERNVFARRLATFTGPEMLDKIARKHREDAEFRADVSRYIESFEDLLKAARGRDRENILLETYLTSQTGKVYMILGTAIGHLKQNEA